MYWKDPNKIKERDKRSLLQKQKQKIEKLAHNKIKFKRISESIFRAVFSAVCVVFSTQAAKQPILPRLQLPAHGFCRAACLSCSQCLVFIFILLFS
jgi:TRAP-type mannitol/chloroaromatic compound transport system substrate-binding protein